MKRNGNTDAKVAAEAGLARPGMEHLQDQARAGVVALLELIDPDPTRPGLHDTPGRVVRAMIEMTRGYLDNPEVILSRQFEVQADELVLLREIAFVSLCEHHLLPFCGTATVGYLPGRRVVGISKLARLVDCYARRLQVQERMTTEIASAMDVWLEARGVGVVVKAQHQCMSCRGVLKTGSEMVTSALLGVLRDDGPARAEFLSLALS